MSMKLGSMKDLLEKMIDRRYLELGAVNHPSPYGAECVMCIGSTQDILARLQDTKLLDDLLKKVPKLIADIKYEESHPYG